MARRRSTNTGPAKTEDEAVSMAGLDTRPDGVDTSIDPRERQPVREPQPDERREEPPPQEEEHQSEPARQMVDYTLPDGRRIRIDSGTAELFRAQEERYTQELAGLRRSLPPSASGQPEPEPPDPLKDFDENLILVDPKGAVRKLYEIIDSGVSQKLTQRYTADQQYQLYMQTFYNRFPDYKGLEDVVQSVLNQHRPMLAAMEPSRGQERLAELCKAHVDRLVSRFAPRDDSDYDESQTPVRRTQLEPGNSQPSRREPAPRAEAAPKMRSISDIIRQRRAERGRRATR